MDLDQQKQIKERIIKFSNDQNLTLNRLAELSNIRQSTLNNIMNRNTIPKVDTIKAICDGLNISVKDFFDFPPYNEQKKDTKQNSEELTQQVSVLYEKIMEMESELKKLKE